MSATKISGQILCTRKKSRKLAFVDFLLEKQEGLRDDEHSRSCQERIELILKPSFGKDDHHCNDIDSSGVEDVACWLKAVCVGDYVTIEGRFEGKENGNTKNNHVRKFRVCGKPLVTKAWKEHSRKTFTPPILQYSTTKPSFPTTIAKESKEYNYKNLCKYFVNTKSCPKGSMCRFVHSATMEDRQAWIKRRRESKLLNGRIKDDTIPLHVKKSKGARADVFADFIVGTFGGAEQINRDGGVFDIAGGRGDLSFQLTAKHRIKCTLVDPRQRKLSKYQRRYIRKAKKDIKRKFQSFQSDHLENPNGCVSKKRRGEPTSNKSANAKFADEQLMNDFLGQHIQGTFDSSFRLPNDGSKPIIVGMHPDQATEYIVDVALTNNLSFAIVPCCVFPVGASVQDKTMSFDAWCKYLCDKADDIKSDFLNFTGANRVIYRTI